jgi:hypothetical protein
LGHGHVLGVKGVRPPEQAGDLPRDLLEHAVTWRPDPQPAHVVELPFGNSSSSPHRAGLPVRAATAPESAAASEPGSDVRRR